MFLGLFASLPRDRLEVILVLPPGAGGGGSSGSSGGSSSGGSGSKDHDDRNTGPGAGSGAGTGAYVASDPWSASFRQHADAVVGARVRGERGGAAS